MAYKEHPCAPRRVYRQVHARGPSPTFAAPFPLKFLGAHQITCRTLCKPESIRLFFFNHIRGVLYVLVIFLPLFSMPSQGQRLRASGRLQEADEVDNMAAAIESRAEDHWRKTVEVNGEVQAPFVDTRV